MTKKNAFCVSSCLRLALSAAPCTVGGQAVIEGVMMRNQDAYSVAVRRPDGSIIANRRPWFSMSKGIFTRRWVRGFPVLVETMVNGIRALNYSTIHSADEEKGEDLKSWQLVLTLCISIAMAMGLFVVLPHMLTAILSWLGFASDVDSFSFQLWDGFFKFAIFIGYISAISFVPDIRRVFQYHGAEHKTIWAYENGGVVSPATAILTSRLHPRCGTTFMLFVLSIAIFLHTVIIPIFSALWLPEATIWKHCYLIAFKLFLMIPISAVSYEVIKMTAAMGDSLFGRMLRGPGLLLQLLTTREPETEHVEVAIVALREALNADATDAIKTPAYTFSE